MSAGRIVAGRFRIVRELGRGGMGTVYSAINLGTERAVALKIPHAELAAEPRFRRRFLREVRAASRLQHPNVIDVLDVVEDESGVPVAVMELLEGAPLSRLLAVRGRLDVAQTASAVVPVLRALHEVHGAGIVHRDLKPENIFLGRGKDGTAHPKLLDFGIARVLGPIGESDAASATQTGSLLGSPSYMAPEQVSGVRDLDRRVDVWAAGVVVYECLSGVRPFRGENFGQIFVAILQQTPEALEAVAEDVPPPVLEAVARALVRDPEKRSPDLLALVDALAPHARPDAIELPGDAGVAELAPTVSTGDDAVAPTIPSVERETHTPPTLEVVTSPAVRGSQAVRSGVTGPSRRRTAVLVVAGVAAVAAAIAAVASPPANDETLAVATGNAPRAEEHAGAEPEALIQAARSSGWEVGEAVAREAVARAPRSRAARQTLAHQLLEKSRLASSGRIAALEEARELLVALLREDPDDEHTRAQLMLAHYLAGDRRATLEELSRLGEHPSAASVRARIAWFSGFTDLAAAEVDRCLARWPSQSHCLFVRHQQIELADGREGLEAMLADEALDRRLPIIARVRIRYLLGRVADGALLVEAGLARGQLDELDRPHAEGMIAARAGRMDEARAHLASLERSIGDESITAAVRMNGAWQTAEVAAAIGDGDAVAHAARAGIELGLWNADYWQRSLFFEAQRDELAEVVADCRARSAAERARLSTHAVPEGWR